MGSTFSSSSSSSPSSRDTRSTQLRRYDRNAAAIAHRHDKSDFTSASDLMPKLNPGDMVQVKGIYFHEWFYSHFAVYIGNGEIIHVTDGDTFKGEVKREDMLKKFAGKDVRKNNHMDGTFEPRRVHNIIFTARRHVGQNWNYNILTNNCEHFASMCRYGRKISLQSLGIADIKNGNISIAEYIEFHVKAVKERCGTFFSWIKRKTVEIGLFSPDNYLLQLTSS